MKRILILMSCILTVSSAFAMGKKKPQPVETPQTLDQIVSTLNQPSMTSILGPYKTALLVAKTISCASNLASLTADQAAQMIIAYPVTLSNYQLSASGPAFTLSSKGDVTIQVQVELSSLGDRIIDGNNTVINEMSFADKDSCVLGYITRHEFTSDGRPLMDLSSNSDGSIKESDFNVPPKSLETIYGHNGYDSKTLEQLETINQDPSRISIAVIDIGIDYNDPVFAYKTNRSEVGLDLLENDFIPSDFSTSEGMATMGDEGHGTAVSALAVQGSDQLSLIAIRHSILALGSNDVKGIDYASNRGARIVNMSFGYTGPNETQEDLMEVCTAIIGHPKLLFVAAADDSNNDNDVKPIYPASCKAPNLIAVGSVDFFGRKSDFSGYGKNTVQIAAKGEGLNLDVGYGSSKKESGTSFAAPQVANVAGKILAINPSLTPSQVIQILSNSASKHSSLAQYFQSSGVLDEGSALDMARKTVK